MVVRIGVFRSMSLAPVLVSMMCLAAVTRIVPVHDFLRGLFYQRLGFASRRVPDIPVGLTTLIDISRFLVSIHNFRDIPGSYCCIPETAAVFHILSSALL